MGERVSTQKGQLSLPPIHVSLLVSPLEFTLAVCHHQLGDGKGFLEEEKTHWGKVNCPWSHMRYGAARIHPQPLEAQPSALPKWSPRFLVALEPSTIPQSQPLKQLGIFLLL